MSTRPSQLTLLDSHARAAGWDPKGALTSLPPALAALRNAAQADEGGAP